MDHGDVRDVGGHREPLGDSFGRNFAIFGRLPSISTSIAVNARHLRDAASVCAVDQHQQPAAARNRGGDHGFDGEGAAALHQDALVIAAGRGAADGQQALANFAHGFRKFGVARAGVAQHGGFDRRAGGERAGSEQQLPQWSCARFSSIRLRRRKSRSGGGQHATAAIAFSGACQTFSPPI